jgi:hypothetical protein
MKDFGKGGSTDARLMCTRGLAMEEGTSITSRTLIAADKVKGANVYNLVGDRLGSVDDILIDKVGGRVIYAVMSFGGFPVGEMYHPLPWAKPALKWTPFVGPRVAGIKV